MADIKAPPNVFKIGGAVLHVRRDTSASWRYNNPVLGTLELGYDNTFKAFKRGDGETPWNQLPWFLKVMEG